LGAASRVRPHRSPIALACVFGAFGASRGALAAVPSSYRLQVVRAEGAGSCPSASVIERDVSQRLGREPFSDAGERGIELVLERTETKWLARLYLRVDASDVDAARLIESDATDCAELGKSVALAVALAIAPDLPPEAEPKPKSEPERVCPLPAPSRPPSPKPTLHGELSLRGLFSSGLLPSSSLGAALAVTLRGKLLGASFGGLFFPENKLQASDVHLGFGVSAAFASGCLWARTQDPQVWSCIGARVGALHSVVYSPEPAQPGDRFWCAASSELGLRRHLFGRAFVEVGAAAVFPLLRHRFEVDASSPPVYEQGPAVFESFVGLGLRLD
jgi:hypothetical protein